MWCVTNLWEGRLEASGAIFGDGVAGVVGFGLVDEALHHLFELVGLGGGEVVLLEGIVFQVEELVVGSVGLDEIAVSALCAERRYSSTTLTKIGAVPAIPDKVWDVDRP